MMFNFFKKSPASIGKEVLKRVFPKGEADVEKNLEFLLAHFERVYEKEYIKFWYRHLYVVCEVSERGDVGRVLRSIRDNKLDFSEKDSMTLAIFIVTRSSYLKAKKIASIFNEELIVIDDQYFCFKENSRLVYFRNLTNKMNDFAKKSSESQHMDLNKIPDISDDKFQNLMIESKKRSSELDRILHKFKGFQNIALFPFDGFLELSIEHHLKFPKSVIDTCCTFFVWQNVLFFDLSRLETREIDVIIKTLNKLPKSI